MEKFDRESFEELTTQHEKEKKEFIDKAHGEALEHEESLKHEDKLNEEALERAKRLEAQEGDIKERMEELKEGLPRVVARYFEHDPDRIFSYGFSNAFWYNTKDGSTGCYQTGLGGDYKRDRERIESNSDIEVIDSQSLHMNQKHIEEQIVDLEEDYKMGRIKETDYKSMRKDLEIELKECYPNWWYLSDLEAKIRYFKEHRLPLTRKGIEELKKERSSPNERVYLEFYFSHQSIL